MSGSLNDSIDSSESFEEKTNDTSPWIDSIVTTNKVSDKGSHWDSADVWLAVVIVLLSLLILVNILVYIKCVRTVNRSLCDTFNDLIFFVFGIIVSPPPTKNRPAAAKSGPSAVYKTSTSSVEVAEGIRPTSCCCFGDRVHEESETATGGNPANKTVKVENRKEEKVVDLRVKMESQPAGGKQEERVQGKHKEEKATGDLRGKMENQPAGGKQEERVQGKHKEEKATGDLRGKMENQPAGQKDNLDERHLGNLNVVKNAEKVFTKVKLQTVPEEQVSMELGLAQSEDASATAEPTYASVIKPSIVLTNVDAAIAPDPEIFI